MSNHRIFRTRLHSRDAGFTFLEIVAVLAILGIISAIALPSITRGLANMRLNGAARGLSNTAAVAKTKAASQFTRARLYVDRNAQTFHVEIWNGTTNQWVADGAITALPTGVTFGWGPVGAPPTNMLPQAIQWALACRDNASPSNPINQTSCIEFNSRGIPVDETTNFGPTDKNTLYIGDGTTVLGLTVAPTGLIGLWTTPSVAAPTWTIS
jgi:prepilin-type N-terminal cleavage/methylation domain-containing protein